MTRPPVAIAHDYLTQRGGAERVVLSLARAYPDAELVTSFYSPDDTYPEFAGMAVRTAGIDRIAPLRRRHRLALPVLAPTFSQTEVDADVTICSTSGWAHGVHATGRKLVYCHAPARWLYQRDAYTAESSKLTRAVAAGLHRPLLRWDQRAARSADLYLANSTRTRDMIRDAYGLDAEVLHPPHRIDPTGSRTPVPGLEPGYFLCVSRLLPYKHVDLALAAFDQLEHERLVVVGRGPDEARLRTLAGPNVTFLPEVDDDTLRWLYANAEALMAFGVEDFGLTPLEAGAFGTPAIARAFGGYLDTVVDGANGVLVDDPTPGSIVAAVARLRSLGLDEATVTERVGPFSESAFVEKIRGHVAALTGT